LTKAEIEIEGLNGIGSGSGRELGLRISICMVKW
jgi:hypothetical protein